MAGGFTSVEKIGPYRVESVLHPGPRRLYKVRAADGRVLALKTIPLTSLTPEIRERLDHEAAIYSTLEHPNLVKVYDSGEADGVVYRAMDLLEGADLGRILAERRPLSWEQKLDIMEQVCEGLEYAHARSLVHRDIKPANLFVETSGRVRILDFGIARIKSSDLAKVGMSVGTLTYMAPEQIRGETCTTGADVFSAGVVFYQLATGRHPFGGEERDLQKILNAILFQTQKPVRELAPDAPEGLDLVLGKALEKNPEQRLRSAGDFKQALGLCRITLRLRPSGRPEARAGGERPAPGEGPVPGARFAPREEFAPGEGAVRGERQAPGEEPAPHQDHPAPGGRPGEPGQAAAHGAAPVAARRPARAPFAPMPPAPAPPRPARLPAQPPVASQAELFDPVQGVPLGPPAAAPAASPPAAVPAPAPTRADENVPPELAPLPKLAHRPDAVVCSFCAHGNPPGATACSRCGQPLLPPPLEKAEAEVSRLRWAVIVLVVVCVLLASLLVLTVVSRGR